MFCGLSLRAIWGPLHSIFRRSEQGSLGSFWRAEKGVKCGVVAGLEDMVLGSVLPASYRLNG